MFSYNVGVSVDLHNIVSYSWCSIVLPLSILLPLCYLFLPSVHIGALVSIYPSLEYTVNSNKNKQKLTFNKTSNFCFVLCYYTLPYHYVSYSLLGGKLVGYRYNNIRSNARSNLWIYEKNLLIIINYYKLLNSIATMVLKCMKFTCPTNRKLKHVWKSRKKVSEYGINQINKGVLLWVPKLITVGEGICTPDDITGVFPWCHQWGKPSK